MELAIEILQDAIIMLKGKIENIKDCDYSIISKDCIIKEYDNDIEDLKKAQDALYYHNKS